MNDHLMNSQQVCSYLGGISAMTLWRYRRDIPDFPLPLKVRGNNFWRAGELEAWAAGRSTGKEVPKEAS